MLRAGLGLNHRDLARIVAEQSAAIIQWTIDDLGVQYEDSLMHLGGHSVPRTHITANYSGSLIIRKQLARVRSLDIPIRLGVCFQRLLRGPDGGVRGVLIQDDFRYGRAASGTFRTIQSHKAVILATGGFANDLTMRTAQDPRLTAEIDITAKRSTTGEGLREALRIGAMPVHLDWIQCASWTSPDERGEGVANSFSFMAFKEGLMVDPSTGKRCVNELGDRRTVVDALWAAGRPCICLVDAGGVARSNDDIERCLRNGVVRQFDGLRELSEAYGIPRNALQETVERYNRAVVAGIDNEFGKPFYPGVAPLDNPPYFAIRLWPKVHHTMGGVQINARAQMLDLEQRPITGLYAAGEVTGGIHRACRLGSCAMTECLIFGRIAGRSAASLLR
jgi:flavocytochrome c